jgi:hypothetical protein
MPVPGMAGWLCAPCHRRRASAGYVPLSIPSSLLLLLLFSWLHVAAVGAMRPSRVADLRRETVDMFYHGFDNYMQIAFPEDEVGPLRPSF